MVISILPSPLVSFASNQNAAALFLPISAMVSTVFGSAPSTRKVSIRLPASSHQPSHNASATRHAGALTSNWSEPSI